MGCGKYCFVRVGIESMRFCEVIRKKIGYFGFHFSPFAQILIFLLPKERSFPVLYQN